MTNLVNILATNANCGNLISDQTSLEKIASIVSTIILILKIAIPVMVVVFGMIDLGKAVMAQKEDEIKKNQGLLIKRIIIAVLIFLVITIVQLVIGLVAGDDEQNVISCVNYIVNYTK